MLAEEDFRKTRTTPSIADLSRFAMTTGIVLVVYVLGRGSLRADVSTTIFPLKLAHPELLLVLLCVVSIYATWRYWYYGVNLPITRTKIRTFLKSKKSILIFVGTEQEIGISALRQNLDSRASLQLDLRSRCPRGLSDKDLTVFTDFLDPGEGYIKELVARKVGEFFPESKATSIYLESDVANSPDQICWAHVKELPWRVAWKAHAEDIDLFAPILVNGFGLSMFLTDTAYCWWQAIC